MNYNEIYENLPFTTIDNLKGINLNIENQYLIEVLKRYNS